MLGKKIQKIWTLLIYLGYFLHDLNSCVTEFNPEDKDTLETIYKSEIVRISKKYKNEVYFELQEK